MSFHVVYLDGYTHFSPTREWAVLCLRDNPAVACVEVRQGSEIVERIMR